MSVSATRISTRGRVIDEIVTTERTFVTNLKTVLDVYIEPLRSRGILSKEEISSLFSNWEYLYPLNKTFLEDLDSTVAKAEEGNDPEGIGEAFKTFGPYFRMFSSYLAGYYRAVDLLEDLEERNRRFAAFLAEAHRDPRCHNLDLLSFLIMPVQRIPRYKLLLESLLKHTPSEHHDYTELQEALVLVSAVAAHNNEHIKKQQSQLKIVEIQKALDTYGPVHINLLDNPSRQFVREGTLSVRRYENGVIKRLNVWLFNDLIVLGRPDTFYPDKFLLKAAWDLGDVVLSRGASEGDQIVMSSPGNTLAGPGIIEDADLALVLTRTTHDPKSPGVVAGNMWLLWAKNVAELEAWAADLTVAIEERTRIKGRPSSGNFSSFSQTASLQSTLDGGHPSPQPHVETESSWMVSLFRGTSGKSSTSSSSSSPLSGYPSIKENGMASMSGSPLAETTTALASSSSAQGSSSSLLGASSSTVARTPRTPGSTRSTRRMPSPNSKPIRPSSQVLGSSMEVSRSKSKKHGEEFTGKAKSAMNDSTFNGFFATAGLNAMPYGPRQPSSLPVNEQLKEIVEIGELSIKAKLEVLQKIRSLGSVKGLVMGAGNERAKRFNEAADGILEIPLLLSSSSSREGGAASEQEMISVVEDHVARENLALDCILELLVLVVGQQYHQTTDQSSLSSNEMPELRSILRDLAAARIGPALSSSISPRPDNNANTQLMPHTPSSTRKHSSLNLTTSGRRKTPSIESPSTSQRTPTTRSFQVTDTGIPSSPTKRTSKVVTQSPRKFTSSSSAITPGRESLTLLSSPRKETRAVTPRSGSSKTRQPVPPAAPLPSPPPRMTSNLSSGALMAMEAGNMLVSAGKDSQVRISKMAAAVTSKAASLLKGEVDQEVQPPKTQTPRKKAAPTATPTPAPTSAPTAASPTDVVPPSRRRSLSTSPTALLSNLTASFRVSSGGGAGGNGAERGLFSKALGMGGAGGGSKGSAAASSNGGKGGRARSTSSPRPGVATTKTATPRSKTPRNK